MSFGHQMEDVLDLDLLSYDALVEQTSYLKAAHKQDEMWRTFVAAQCETKTVKKVIKSMQPKTSKPEESQEGDFLEMWSKKL